MYVLLFKAKMYYKLRGNLFMNHNVNCDFYFIFQEICKNSRNNNCIVYSTVRRIGKKKHIKPLLRIGILVRRRERILLYKSMFFFSFSWSRNSCERTKKTESISWLYIFKVWSVFIFPLAYFCSEGKRCESFEWTFNCTCRWRNS